MIETITKRLEQLRAEREQLQAQISEQLKRDAAELNARARAAIAPHDRAIAELEALLARAETPAGATVGCGVTPLP